MDGRSQISCAPLMQKNYSIANLFVHPFNCFPLQNWLWNHYWRQFGNFGCLAWYGCNRIKFQKSGSSPYNTSDLRFNLYLISRYIHSTKNLPSLIFWQSWNLLLLRISKLSLLFTFVKVEAEIVRVKDTRDHFQVHIYMHYKENENWRWPLVSLT